MCSQLLDWLIYREAWEIGRDLKQDASRFAKVNRVEVLAIHHRSDIEVETSQSLAPRLLLLIIGRSPCHVMDRSSRNQSAPELRSTSYINIRPRSPLTNFVAEHIVFLAQGTKAEGLGQEFGCTLVPILRQGDGVNSSDSIFGRYCS